MEATQRGVSRERLALGMLLLVAAVLLAGDFRVVLANSSADDSPVLFGRFLADPGRYQSDLLHTYAYIYAFGTAVHWLPTLLYRVLHFPLEISAYVITLLQTVLLGFALHMFGVYSLSVWFLSRIHPLDFFRRIKTVMLTAFSTSSSNATLPTALRVSEENLGVPREINGFVLTVGATANQNGTALYEGATVLFLAQLAGVDLTIWQQLGIAYFAILGGIGTAGVPSASIPFIIVMLATYGINPALIAIILGVDRILDMCRTVLNVSGDLTAATYVARSEGFPLLGRKTGTE